MKTDKGLLFLVGYLAFSGAAMGYLGTDESYKYISPALRFWIIGWFIVSNATAVAVKAFYTENQKPLPPAPPPAPLPQPPVPPAQPPNP